MKQHLTLESASLRVRPSVVNLSPVILALLPFVLFWREALGLRVFYHHDLQYYFYPYHKLVADIVAEGRLPLWNPYAFSGIPLIGDGQTAMFYPPNWLFFLLPPIHALSVVVLLQFSIAGVGMWAYTRHLRLGTLAAIVAALAFMFNGFLVARVVHLSIMAGAALIPAVFWAVDRLLTRPGAARLAVAAALIAFQALAGHPQVPIYTAVGLGVYALVFGFRRWRRGERTWPPIALLAASYVAGYGLAAIQLAPWIDFARFSPRAAGASYEFVTGQSLRYWDWLLWLFPYAYGGPRETLIQSTPAWDLPVYLWERLSYIGVLPLALAIVGLADLRADRRAAATDESIARRDRLIALTVVLIVALLITAGSSTPFGRLVYLLPAIGRLRAYARAIAVATFALCVLAAFGVERLQRPSSRRADRAPLIAGGALLATAIWALFAANVLGADAFASTANEQMYRVLLDRSLRLAQANALVPLLLLLATIALLGWAWRGWRRPIGVALIGLTALDLGAFALSFNPVMPPDTFERVPPSVAFLRSDPDPFRTASFIREDKLPPSVAQAQLAISWAIPYHVEDINGFNSLQPRRYTDLLFGPQVEDVSYGFLIDQSLLDPQNRLLSLLNVRYALVQPQAGIVPPEPVPSMVDPDNSAAWQPVYRDADVTIYRNPRPLPRAYSAAQVVLQPDAHAILDALRQPDYDPRALSFVESGMSLDEAQRLSQPAAPAQIAVTQVAPDELRLDVSAAADRLVVLSEMWFPGWRAEIDGQATPIYRANYLLRGIVVPAGQHTVRLVYRPASATIGVALTGLTILALGGVALRQRRRAR